MENIIRLFLGANSSTGFINRFYDAYKENLDRKIYLIKGGPGTGKSSFMKKVAEVGIRRGEKVTLCPCSSDPDSLDGIILRGSGICIFDATAPHTLDPVYPGAVENIIDFTPYWNKDKLRQSKSKIIELNKENKMWHINASCAIAAAGKVLADNMRVSLLACDIEKTVEFALKTANRLIPATQNKGTEQIAFLSAVTPKGYITFDETIPAIAKTVVKFYDPLGSAGNIFLSIIRDIALNRGHNVITVNNPVLNEEKQEHIILPDLELAFSVIADEKGRQKGERLIRFERFCDNLVIKANRKRITLNKKLYSAIINTAVLRLKNAKETHDKLEEVYKSAMDYGALNEFTDSFINIM